VPSALPSFVPTGTAGPSATPTFPTAESITTLTIADHKIDQVSLAEAQSPSFSEAFRGAVANAMGVAVANVRILTTTSSPTTLTTAASAAELVASAFPLAQRVNGTSDVTPSGRRHGAFEVERDDWQRVLQTSSVYLKYAVVTPTSKVNAQFAALGANINQGSFSAFLRARGFPSAESAVVPTSIVSVFPSATPSIAPSAMPAASTGASESSTATPGMGAGAIAGIVIGAIAGVLCLGGCAWAGHKYYEMNYQVRDDVSRPRVSRANYEVDEFRWDEVVT
jgi:hypothetical protein